MAEIVIVASLLVLALAFVTFTARRMRVAESVDPIGRARFVKAFDGEGISPTLVGHAYDAIRRRLDSPVELLPTTDLLQELHFSRLDVEDIALLAVARTHGRLPRGEELDALDVRVGTAGELVRFLAPFCPAQRPNLRVAG